jgi:hypothetical protein
MDAMVESAFIAAAATLVGVGGTVVVAIVVARMARSANQLTLDVVRQGQVTDRYAQAVDHLGSPNLDVRRGGIYALEGIARDSASDHPTVMEVLTAFIREHSNEQWPLPEHDTDPAPRRETRPDVQAALTVIGRRHRGLDIRPIDLSGAGLADAKLPHGAHLVAAKLARADLTRVDLGGADLTEANLTEAILIHAVLRPVDLTDAELADVKHPRGAHRVATKLARADLTDADLTGADLTGADLTGADLTGTKWPADTPIPEGWKLDTGTGRLAAASTDSTSAEAN